MLKEERKIWWGARDCSSSFRKTKGAVLFEVCNIVDHFIRNHPHFWFIFTLCLGIRTINVFMLVNIS
jgi:hypothetical protein